MNDSTIKDYALRITSYSGNAFAHFYNACQSSVNDDTKAAQDYYHKGIHDINAAHELNAVLIDYETTHGNLPFSLILTHAQDTLMTAINWQHIASLTIEQGAFTTDTVKERRSMNDTLRILIICNAGMSTTILKNRLESVAIERSIKVDIKASTFNDLERLYFKNDIVLISPQISHLIDEINRIMADTVPALIINMSDFGLMKADNIFDAILDTLNLSI